MIYSEDEESPIIDNEELCLNEGWTITQSPNLVDKPTLHTPYGDYQIDIPHPIKIYFKVYREHHNPEERYKAMVKIHHFLWPDHIKTWNYWMERMFRAHAEHFKLVVNCGGAGIGKSATWAKIAIIFWLAQPRRRAVLVASTTLQAIETRIWGYVMRYVDEMALAMPIDKKSLGSSGGLNYYTHPNHPSKLFMMKPVAIPEGADERQIKNLIGIHPDGGLLFILDEATDMPPAVIKSSANLEEGTEFYQMAAIGNSKSRTDTHGALATPKIGWDNISWKTHDVWETCQDGGIALYFNPYKSPAIHEKDPVKKKLLSKFLVTKEKIIRKRRALGDKSEEFWRFTLGYWPPVSMSDAGYISIQFLNEHEINNKAEWSGFYPKQMCAGLDPAFSFGTNGCVLRLGAVGHCTDGKVRIDYMNDELLFRINISMYNSGSAERQIATQVIDILKKYNIPLSHLAIDANGPGRALGELIKTLMGTEDIPLNITTKRSAWGSKNSPDRLKIKHLEVIPITATELWFAFRQYVQEGQIRGIDPITSEQISNRMVIMENNKYEIESKISYRTRMTAINPLQARSPDEADALMLSIQSAYRGLGILPGMTRTSPLDIPKNFYDEKMYMYQLQQGANVVGVNDLPGGGAELVPNQETLIKNALSPRFLSSVDEVVAERHQRFRSN